MNEKGTDFRFFLVELEPATPAYEVGHLTLIKVESRRCTQKPKDK